MTDNPFDNLPDDSFAIRFDPNYLSQEQVTTNIKNVLTTNRITHKLVPIASPNSRFEVISVDVEGEKSQTLGLLQNLVKSSVLSSTIDSVIPQPGSSPGPSTTGGPSSQVSSQAIEAACGEEISFELPRVEKSNPFFHDQNKKVANQNTVNVFVLDVSPYVNNAQTKFEFQVGGLSGIGSGKVHPFVSNFVRNGKFELGIVADALDQVEGEFVENREPMANHGIFTASIIKTIAPEANVTIIPIIPVTKDGKLSKMLDILEGIRRDSESILRSSQILVNISAYAESPFMLFSKDSDSFDNNKNKIFNMEIFKDQITSIREFLLSSENKEMIDPNRRIIAAAGNDRERTSTQPWPRFPAFVKDVISVGSIRSDTMLTDYSNLAQIPNEAAVEHKQILDQLEIATKNGIYAYGGTANEGLKGLYVNDDFYFPNGTKESNLCGVAKWSGTSFATAVVTGYMAWLCLRGFNAADAERMLRENLPTTDDGIPILMAKQS